MIIKASRLVMMTFQHNQMTLFVPVFVILPTFFTVLPRWKDHLIYGIEKYLEEIICIIRAIDNQAFNIQFSYKSHRLSDAVSLTSS